MKTSKDEINQRQMSRSGWVFFGAHKEEASWELRAWIMRTGSNGKLGPSGRFCDPCTTFSILQTGNVQQKYKANSITMLDFLHIFKFLKVKLL